MFFYIIPQEVRFFKEVQKMKLYKVTTISDFNVKEVFTVHADSKREAIMKAYDTNMDGNIVAIEEVD
jgi:hypothetical protein